MGHVVVMIFWRGGATEVYGSW